MQSCSFAAAGAASAAHLHPHHPRGPQTSQNLHHQPFNWKVCFRDEGQHLLRALFELLLMASSGWEQS
jgi:hypothetical protein